MLWHGVWHRERCIFHIHAMHAAVVAAAAAAARSTKHRKQNKTVREYACVYACVRVTGSETKERKRVLLMSAFRLTVYSQSAVLDSNSRTPV